MRRVGRRLGAGVGLLVTAGFLHVTAPAAAVTAPVGAGFTVTTGDLSFILKQIKIAERHTMTLTPANPCGTLLNQQPGQPSDGIPDAEQVPNILTSYGLRTVDGTCNNLKAGSEKFAAADVPFPRLTTPIFKAAENSPPGFGPLHPTSYAQKKGSVFDSQPRVISNLIVDQTSTNPAALAAAAHPVRTQNAPSSATPCTTDPGPGVTGVPAGCTPSHSTLFIPNVTTDVGLSPPYNSMFTFFGQFFDHGVDQTVKSGGTVFVPLKADDPLIPGPDHVLGTNCGSTDPAVPPSPECADNLPANQQFMVLTRAQNQPGPDGILGDKPPTDPGAPVTCTALNVPAGCDESADDIQNANNTDTPWVDQSQTYTSHASHQVFLREYANNAGGKPVSTGRLLAGLPAGQTYLNSPDGTEGIGTWLAVKQQAATLLGLKLVDTDVTNIPMIASDPYGKFIPGPARGLPQYVTASGMVEGDTANPVPVPADALHFDTPFLTDIAHNADPSPQRNPTGGVPIIPVPDADDTPSADFANQPAGTYDDEMLNAHFACGDGRCNENIALSTIHQVFHSEHDRLAAEITATLTADTSTFGVAELAKWQDSTTVAAGGSGYNFGERLFQAARFITEMEYQHLVFEEFARKMQPLVRPFHVYSPDINPAVRAEFAHAVYRFGHSMLDDDVARTNTATNGAKSSNDVPLLTAFLNPPEFFNGGTAGVLTAKAAAGSIVMGSSDQVGNELDEFVTETLRNNLLGLPLDLPVLNMTRAREAGVPPLNGVRRQIFNQTNDGQLAPYTSWSDFGQHLKHPESLINFVAAYGHHQSIIDATTLVAKRDAARAIVNPTGADVPPADAADFMFSTGAWGSDGNGVTNTGVDDVDLWVGGLAEITNLFGGLLGSTFNYVFQNQLENLQDGDRLYYLARTPGMNLRTQLESNSFSEIIQRNTDNTNTLKADVFATADCKFQLSHLAGTPAGFTEFGSSVADDLTTTDCNENLLLIRQPNGTIQYRQFNTVNPSGINGQSVYNGTAAADRVFGGNDNDTFWGGAGNDVIEGNGGDDVALGGDGNDIITDLSGFDVLKGGPGNDAIDAGLGNDIMMGGDGQDFMNGGANDNEEFAGPGNDFVIAGQGADAVFGDGGDDWIEGGTGQDLLQGDHGAPFFDDPASPTPGNDIMVGQVGENDYDAEGGDDIMAQNAAVDRNAGAGGWDWAIHQYNTIAADDDMMINANLGALALPVIVNRDRWQETEADSGAAFNDVIKGNDGVLSVPRLISGGGFSGCNALDQDGVSRIPGLSALLPPVTAWPGTAAAVAALSVSGRCPLTGPVWGEGDILIGGPGSDTITGRGGNEIIDGDKSLNVAISVRTTSADPASEIGRTDLMENKATSGNFGAGTANMTLQQAVFAGLVDPGNLVGVREITNTVTAPADCGAVAPVNCDTAVFSGPRSNYSITPVAASGTTLASFLVTQTGANVVGQKISDGADTIRNIEALKFSDQTLLVQTPAVPTNVTATTTPNTTGTTGTAVVSWTAPTALVGVPAISNFNVVTSLNGTVVRTTAFGRTATNGTITNLVAGGSYTFQVQAVNVFGPGTLSASTAAITPLALAGAPTSVVAVRGSASANLSWTAPVLTGGSPITDYTVTVRTGTTVVPAGPPIVITVTGTTATVTGLTNGTAYNFQVRAVNAQGTGAPGTSGTVIPATVPDAPTVGTAAGVNSTTTAGSATLAWTPGFNGGSAITSYSIVATPTLVGTIVTRTGISSAATSGTVTGLLNGTTYTLQVRAVNVLGTGLPSAASNAVTPTGVPGAPTAVVGTRGNTTVALSWTAPIVDGGTPITSYTIQVRVAGAVVATATSTGTSTTITGLTNGTAYTFRVLATNANGSGALSVASAAVTPASAPTVAPVLGTATLPPVSQGAVGSPLTATVNWTGVPVAGNGGSAINGYTATVRNNLGAVVQSVSTATATIRSVTFTFSVDPGPYTFEVLAFNSVGDGPASAPSAPILAR